MENLSANALEVGHSLLTREVTGCAAFRYKIAQSPSQFVAGLMLSDQLLPPFSARAISYFWPERQI
jgi:hypothetical protein